MSETSIEIGGTIPLDVAATLMTLIGRAYPSATVTNRPGTVLTVLVDNDDRREVSDAEVDESRVRSSDPESEAQIGSIGPDGLTISDAREAGAVLLAAVHHFLDGSDAATNYVEILLNDPDGGPQYAIAACRSAGQTPHALRKATEARLREVRAFALEREHYEWDSTTAATTGHADGYAQGYQEAVRDLARGLLDVAGRAQD